MITLKVIKGKETGAALTYHAPEITLGRSPENTLVLSDQHISRHHARIRFSEDGAGQYLFSDLGSVGGSYVRRQGKEYVMTADTREMALRLGDELVLGNEKSVVSIEALGLRPPAEPEPELERAVQRLGMDELPRIYDRVYSDQGFLQHIVEFDRLIVSSTSPEEVLNATVNHLAHVYPKSVYVAALEEPYDPDAFCASAMGEHAPPSDAPPPVRLSQTIRKLARDAHGVRYTVAGGTKLISNGKDQMTLSEKSMILDPSMLESMSASLRGQGNENETLRPQDDGLLENMVGMAAPIVVQGGTAYVIQLEGNPTDMDLSEDSLDLLMVFAARASSRIENIRAMEQLARQGQLAMAGVVTKCLTHDLGNVVAKLSGPVSLIESGAWDRFPDERKRDFISMLNYGVKLAMARCHDFLDMDKSVSHQPEDLKAVAEGVVRNCRGVFGSAVEIKVLCGAEVPTISCDRRKIERIVWNLLDNAYKVIREKSLESARLSVEIDQWEQGVRLAVRDNFEGGMPEEDHREFLRLRDQIFSLGADSLDVLDVLITRMDNANQRRKQGYGIGSFFFCMTVRNMGGTLDVETGPEGSCFSFALPVS